MNMSGEVVNVWKLWII